MAAVCSPRSKGIYPLEETPDAQGSRTVDRQKEQIQIRSPGPAKSRTLFPTSQSCKVGYWIDDFAIRLQSPIGSKVPFGTDHEAQLVELFVSFGTGAVAEPAVSLRLAKLLPNDILYTCRMTLLQQQLVILDMQFPSLIVHEAARRAVTGKAVPWEALAC